MEGAFLPSLLEQGDMQALEEAQAILAKTRDYERWKHNHAVRSSQEAEKGGRKHDKVSSFHESHRARSVFIRSFLYQLEPDNHMSMACEGQKAQPPSHGESRLRYRCDGLHSR